MGGLSSLITQVRTGFHIKVDFSDYYLGVSLL